ncbi:MAG: lamin tail domain-containing protein [Candidatus Nanoarchaeia archaeon]|nr:lamin tail domain-containing protein [Candidatus Nanoarchaeia archaeon]
MKWILILLLIPLVSALEISEFLPNPDDEVEFIEIYNPSDQQINLETYSIQDKTNSTRYFTDVSGGSVIYPNSYLILKTKAFLNNDGFEEIKLFQNETLIDKVNYDSTKKGLSFSKINNEWVLTKPTPSKENKKEKVNLESELEIVKIISRENISFGDMIQIKLKIYRADTTKKEIKLSLEKDNERISNVISLMVENSYENLVLEVPFQIPINCDKKYQDGFYTLKIQGLDLELSHILALSGQNQENCVIEKETIEKEVIKYKECTTETILKSQSDSNPKVVYESKQEKSKRFALFMFSGLLVLLLIKKWQ